ncbi:gluconokinase [Brucella endophytica]|uniref:Gluconokinase n=1 Tax=Brucella endophytica TaxID=1963359 RepID=A0A916SJU2_9HYPH|nr:gluconokinase [Brucella endophytica]GGB01218.1 gluconokinase [Brucella endophytica]
MATGAALRLQPDFVLVMGVCGAGKSTVGKAIAERTDGRFIEADEYHPEENIKLMSAGRPLTDAERWPWLAALARAASDTHAQGKKPVIIACSALKRRYRDFLRGELGSLTILHLSGSRELIGERLAARRSHFMPPALLDSQLADLEELADDEGGIALPVNEDPMELVARACDLLGLPKTMAMNVEGGAA